MDNQISQYQSLPGNMLYNNLIANIEQGQIKIPQFQRKFVWSIEETAGLIDSILKGYPIGTFILFGKQMIVFAPFVILETFNSRIHLTEIPFNMFLMGSSV